MAYQGLLDDQDPLYDVEMVTSEEEREEVAERAVVVVDDKYSQ